MFRRDFWKYVVYYFYIFYGKKKRDCFVIELKLKKIYFVL